MVFPVNARLRFQVPVGDPTDDDRGLPSVATEDFWVDASLTELQLPTRNQDTDAASDRQAIRLEGRCINPKTLPATLNPGTKAIAYIDGREGTFTLEPVVQNRFVQVTEALGEKIRGRFEVRVLWGQGNG